MSKVSNWNVSLLKGKRTKQVCIKLIKIYFTITDERGQREEVNTGAAGSLSQEIIKLTKCPIRGEMAFRRQFPNKEYQKSKPFNLIPHKSSSMWKLSELEQIKTIMRKFYSNFTIGANSLSELYSQTIDAGIRASGHPRHSPRTRDLIKIGNVKLLRGLLPKFPHLLIYSWQSGSHHCPSPQLHYDIWNILDRWRQIWRTNTEYFMIPHRGIIVTDSFSSAPIIILFCDIVLLITILRINWMKINYSMKIIDFLLMFTIRFKTQFRFTHSPSNLKIIKSFFTILY